MMSMGGVAWEIGRQVRTETYIEFEELSEKEFFS